MEKAYLTCEDISNDLGFKTSTIWNWIRNGKLPVLRIGRNYRVSSEDYAEFKKRLSEANEKKE